MPGTQDRPTNKTNLKLRLAETCRGLFYPSETDAPVEPIFGGEAKEVSTTTIAGLADSIPSAFIEEVEFEKFFEKLTTEREWYVAEQRKNAKGFAKLQRLLKSEMKSVRVFRIGKIRIDIYVVGIDSEGNLAGVKTFAVET